MTKRDVALGELLTAATHDPAAYRAVVAWRKGVQTQKALEDRVAMELPLVPEYFEFAYSDDGANDPLTVLLEREANDELTLERITVGNHTTINFIFHKD